MIAFGLEALEREGKLWFSMRDGVADAEIAEDGLARHDDLSGQIETLRVAEAEIAGRVRLAFIEAEGDYEARTVEAIFPDEESRGVAQSEFSLALTRAEGQRMVERWLSEARIARDGARFALPPSLMHLGAGDVVSLATADGTRSYRIDRLENAGAQIAEAVRVEEGVYEASDEAEERAVPRAFVAPVPVTAVFLDLPLMVGTEVPHAPHLAAIAQPWPGSVAVWSSDSDDGYALNRLIASSALLGETLTPLFAADPAMWDRGEALRVRVGGGTFASAGEVEVLNGANLVAIGDGEIWELMQFAAATLVGPETWELSNRLRGQAGTDAISPGVWPVGSLVVAMNGAPRQIDLASPSRGLARHYRIGPSQRGFDNPSFQHIVRAFDGVGLRPLSPAHLRAEQAPGGDVSATWIRRTRIDGDSWVSYEVPLGESFELYLVRVVESSVIRREATVPSAAWHYSAAMRASDGIAGPYSILVAQVSESFGPGPFTRIEIDG